MGILFPYKENVLVLVGQQKKSYLQCI